MDLPTFATVAGSLKGAAETLRTMVNIRDEAAFQPKANELHSQINAALSDALTAYETQRAQLERIRELEDEVRTIKTWEAEKKRYALNQLPPGVFVMSLKPDLAGEEPMHQICKTCFEHGKKSVLDSGVERRGVRYLTCTECKTRLEIGTPQPLRMAATSYNPFSESGDGLGWMR